MTSIIVDKDLTYPDRSDGFSPSERYPEYPFDQIATTENRVYRAVRETFVQAGLDAGKLGTPDWNPLGRYIKKGDKVFILCNFVYHRRPQESERDFFGKCTHASVVRALIDYVYIAAGRGAEISFGNAPLQSCVWDQVLRDSGATDLLEFYGRQSVGVTARDLRLVINQRNILGRVTLSKEGDDSDATTVPLGKASLLDDLYHAGQAVKFRVSDYNPERIERFHARGTHDYVINNEIITSDVIISVPKLKTHEKVGITVGLKGFVGCVGHKDCLAHHRFGPPASNGDEYPDNGSWQLLVSRFHDFTHRRHYPALLSPLFEVLDNNVRRLMRRVLRKIQAGAWHGNDTAWRMTVDLAHIVHYADKQGTLSDRVQRRHLALVDGVVGGEGDGPLSPRPVESRTVFFSDNIVLADLTACRLMGFNPDALPLTRHASHDPALFETTQASPVECRANGAAIDLGAIGAVLGRPFVPPSGWKGAVS